MILFLQFNFVEIFNNSYYVRFVVADFIVYYDFYLNLHVNVNV